ncbi:MAG: hypothetical protein IKJ37_01660, partial [Kiritimatiellae bacterium]|nr:hypothetical protein [Kiritimatiellia bacterium]
MKNAIAKVVLASILPTVALTVIHAAVPSTATQNVPGKMNYQGYLRDPSTGDAYVDGIYTLDCRIYSNDMGGTPLWGGRYSAYVKDGYFNIMLGDENATQNLDDMSGITYTGAANLWKALWGANSTDCKRFLGVTPLQDANHAVISSPTEIMPRQELLTAPFAFRAQSAQYASEAKENFTVGGNLTVNGTTTFSGTINASTGTQSIGPIRASSSSVNLGNGYTSATSSNRASLPSSIYNVGQYLYFYSYYAMNFKPTAGNINFTVPSGYDMKVTGAGDFISDVPVNTIGGTGATTIKGGTTTISGTGATTISGGTTTIKSSSSAKVELSGTTATMSGSTVNLSGVVNMTGGKTKIAGHDVHILPLSKDAQNYGVFGQGEVRWAHYNQDYTSDSACVKPFKIIQITATIPSGSRIGSQSLSSYGTDYNWTVVGFIN